MHSSLSFKSFFVSVAANKCPSCLEGKFFIHPPYNLKKFAQMNDKCPKCRMSFRQEPGFYFGAAFVSYGIQVALLAAAYVIFQLFAGLNLWLFIGCYALILLLLVPVVFRTSRLVWINLAGNRKKTG